MYFAELTAEGIINKLGISISYKLSITFLTSFNASTVKDAVLVTKLLYIDDAVTPLTQSCDSLNASLYTAKPFTFP